MIGIRNQSKEKLKARFDGTDYVFEVGVTTACSEEAARHIFGYGERDKSKALHRLGWLGNVGQMEEGIRRLDDFQFLAVEDVKFKEDSGTVNINGKKEIPKDAKDAGVALSAAEQEFAAALNLNKPVQAASQFKK